MGQMIEPVARTVERMKLKSFEDAVLADLGYPLDWKNPEAALYRGSLKARALPNTDLIVITVRGYSRKDAKRSAEATVAYLRKIHDEMAAPTVQRLRQRLVQIEWEIAKTRAEKEKILKIAGLKDKAIAAEAGLMESLTLANFMFQRDSELRGLEEAKVVYEEQLGSMHTYPTALIEKISVSENPVTPKKAMIIPLAGILGLILGMMTAFLSNAVQLKRGGV
jgi:capsular polysaccharide biosynthesis protein